MIGKKGRKETRGEGISRRGKNRIDGKGEGVDETEGNGN